LELAVFGVTCYWVITSLLGQNVLVYAQSLIRDLEKGELLTGIPPAAYGVGIGLGAMLSSRMSGDRIEYGLIPLGAIGFALSSLLLGILEPGMAGAAGILVLMGVTSGLIVVPLHAIMQWRSPSDRRGAIIALGNVFEITGMVVGSLIAMGMALLGLDLGMMLITSALLVVVAAVLAIRILPRALVRLCFILLTKTVYRFRLDGIENMPKEGPVLLTPNHLSIIDALFVAAAIDRPVHFVMSGHYYKNRLLRPLADLMQAIPVSSTGSTRELLTGLRRAGECLDKGGVVCIFPEGQISHTGTLLPFQRGVEVIMKGRDYPIVPVHLDNVWGSIFSFHKGRFFKKWPRNIPYSIRVSFGKPMPGTSSVSEIRHAIQELECDAWLARKEDQKPLHQNFIEAVRRHPNRLLLVEKDDKRVTGIQSLTMSIAFGRELRDHWKDEEVVGLMLPTCIAATWVSVAVSMSGRTSVNLNFTAGIEAIESAIQQTELRTVITSRKLLDTLSLRLPDDLTLVFVEDIYDQIDDRKKQSSMLLARLASCRRLELLCGATQVISSDDVATIIFTSGSSGPPKGVMLTHSNIVSNVDAVAQVIPSQVKPKKIVATLPLFHSFGYMMMWLGLNHDISLVMHPNPMDYVAISELVHSHEATILMTTPTFLRIYHQRIPARQFGSLVFILTGAEKLPSKLADAFEEDFGIRPLEGYGATECSPVIATSTLDVRTGGIYQVGSIRGSVGLPLPGILVKVVDPESYEEVPNDLPGLLMVRGHNVMLGYLGQEDLTAEKIHDGWYITGDLGMVNDDGFVTITDRLSRFSKIGGEMVPHGRIEEALHQSVDGDYQSFVVTAVPDAKVGERLVVIHSVSGLNVKGTLSSLKEQGLPNLYIPKANQFVCVDEIPVLGSGKLDLQRTKALALEHCG
ncbi:Bifunctional protein Aas, partial [Chlamydiales bacterium SCGC AG-110-P3]